MAWEPLGWSPVFFSEIDKFPSAVLKHHWPDVPNFGDMTKFKEWPDVSIDLLVGGTPCQSFSVAGLRKGMDDPRGNLALTYLAIAARYRPRWLVWENVPGVLSSGGGRDFGSLLGAMVKLGYGIAYRVLDAQYVRTRQFSGAVPQRRRRVFVVGYSGDWRRAAAVLFDAESMQGNPPPRREAGKKPAPTPSARTSGGGGLGTDFDLDGGIVPDCSPALKARDYKGPSSDGDGDGAPILPVAIQERAVSENPDAGPDGAGVRTDGASYTLEARTVPQAVAFAENDRAEVRLCGGDGQVSSALAGPGGKPGQGAPAIAFDCKGTEVQTVQDGSHPTLRSMGHHNSHSNAGGHAAVAQGMAVRRLTPVECERLQGFPDNHTQIPYRKKSAGDCPVGPRYKALGNSMAVPVMQWIGHRIAMVEELQTAGGATL